MIANLRNFILRRKPLWAEYGEMLDLLERDPSVKLSLKQIQRLRELHEHVAGDLVRVRTFASEPETVDYLESLLARGFGFIHENHRFRFSRKVWPRLFRAFPDTLRRHLRMFQVVTLTFLLGAMVGGILVRTAPDAKEVLLPFPHLHGDPSDRVAEEESAEAGDGLRMESTFAAQLMTHNIRVSIFALVIGAVFGVFTLVLVFYNGVILGAVCVDYIAAGEGIFLSGWLLPHGSVEIPAILFAATAGLIIAKAVFIRQDRAAFSTRMRRIRGDVVILISGVSVLLVWAGLIESFFSQYHSPVLPYSVKILFGSVQLSLLALCLAFVKTPGPEGTE